MYKPRKLLLMVLCSIQLTGLVETSLWDRTCSILYNFLSLTNKRPHVKVVEVIPSSTNTSTWLTVCNIQLNFAVASLPFIRPPRLTKWLYKRGGLSSSVGQFRSIYYLSASEIWPDKRGGLWWSGLKWGTMVIYYKIYIQQGLYNWLYHMTWP